MKSTSLSVHRKIKPGKFSFFEGGDEEDERERGMGGREREGEREIERERDRR